MSGRPESLVMSLVSTAPQLPNIGIRATEVMIWIIELTV